MESSARRSTRNQVLSVLITLSTSDTMRSRSCAREGGREEERRGEMSKNYSAHLPVAYPPRKSKSRSPLFDDPEIPRRAAPARTSGSPTGSRRTPTRRPYTCTSPANSTKRTRGDSQESSSLVSASESDLFSLSTLTHFRLSTSCRSSYARLLSCNGRYEILMIGNCARYRGVR